LVELYRTPALLGLEWVLAGLDGADGWGADVEGALSPEFLAEVSAETYLRRVDDRRRRWAPTVVLGVDIRENTARARIRGRDGGVRVVGCIVGSEPPHRIVNTWVLDEMPGFLTPPLPTDFDASETYRPAVAAGPGSRLVVLSGVPGTGKSTLADAVGRATGTPAFSADWLLGALTPFGGYHLPDLLGIAEELLTTLAFRQLSQGQSAILDAPTEDVVIRNRWRSLADAFGADLRVVVCVCSDPALHRQRVEGRHRGIPGWHDAGDWQNVKQRMAAFPPWEGESLIVDGVQPLDRNLQAVVEYVGR
jgi:predicted kinase